LAIIKVQIFFVANSSQKGKLVIDIELNRYQYVAALIALRLCFILRPGDSAAG
jgi:hypothetical protein